MYVFTRSDILEIIMEMEVVIAIAVLMFFPALFGAVKAFKKKWLEGLVFFSCFLFAIMLYVLMVAVFFL